MTEDIVFETKDEKKYAPPSNWSPPITVDAQLETELKSVPQKMAFKIGEVAEIAGVKPYVLRYWETEFEALRPDKSRHNQRVYLRKDVDLVLMIKKLLYRDRFSIEGARGALKKLKKENKKQQVLRTASEGLEQTRDDVQELVLEIARLKKIFS